MKFQNIIAIGYNTTSHASSCGKLLDILPRTIGTMEMAMTVEVLLIPCEGAACGTYVATHHTEPQCGPHGQSVHRRNGNCRFMFTHKQRLKIY